MQAIHQSTGQTVAVKVIRLGSDSHLYHAFGEVSALVANQHDNVVRFRECFFPTKSQKFDVCDCEYSGVC